MGHFGSFVEKMRQGLKQDDVHPHTSALSKQPGGSVLRGKF